MEHITTYPLSLLTLTLTFAVPFLYFIYQTNYWYRPDVLKNLDFLLQALAVLILSVIALRIPNLRGAQTPVIHLTLLHLLGPILTFFIVRRTRLERWMRAQSTTGNQGAAKPEKKPEQFKPIPPGREIERINWDSLVISRSLKEELLATIELLKKPKEARKYGIDAPKGMLFYGPPGTGKTTIAKAMANTAGLSFFPLMANEVVSKWVGESEKNLSALFQAAARHAPAVIFIDEIDAIGRSRSGGSGQAWSDNLLNHLLQLIDGVAKTEGLYIIGATNRVELVDSALKRAGRLNKVIEIPLPDFESRIELFAEFLSRLNLEPQISLEELASFTEGCSGADIKEICNQAGLNAFKRESYDGEKREYTVNLRDLEQALVEFSGRRPEKEDINTAHN